MSILNDNQIRSLCLVPTHTWGRYNNRGTQEFLSKAGDVYYFIRNGQKVQQKHGDIQNAVPLPDTVRFPDLRYMISPFEPTQIRIEEDRKIISYGTSSMGYDVRLARTFKIFTNVFSALIDPLDMPDRAYVDHEGDFVIIPPNSYALGHTVEYFKMPDDVTAICVGKSTYARAGCAVNVTPIEAGWEGQVVMELANLTNLPMKVYAGMGIAQFIFFRGEKCGTSYADRNGKYQGQTGIQVAIV